MTRQALFALALIVFDGWYLYQSFDLPRPFATGEPGPAFFPWILAAVLGLAAFAVLVQELSGRPVPGEDTEGARVTWRTVVLIALTAGFAWAFEPLGYWVATALYTFAVAWLFEQERAGALKATLTGAIIAAGITGAGWLFFVTLFELFLPEGNF
ncbi:tripartite tricarboxylate transporter TctB family protein [Salipiger mucosus]|nr:tripartite tricarboxylate transporter TctB family protein [Salipiger mucosus]